LCTCDVQDCEGIDTIRYQYVVRNLGNVARAEALPATLYDNNVHRSGGVIDSQQLRCDDRKNQRSWQILTLPFAMINQTQTFHFG